MTRHPSGIADIQAITPPRPQLFVYKIIWTQKRNPSGEGLEPEMELRHKKGTITTRLTRPADETECTSRFHVYIVAKKC